MNNFGSYGPRRTEMRKKQKQNTVVNGAIILTVIGIVFFAGTLIFGNNSEPAAVDELEEEQNEEESLSDDVEDLGEPEETVDSSEEETDNSTEETEERDTEKESTFEEETATDASEEEEATPATVVGEGQWNPIGTVQEEPFVAVYEKDHVNWEEMLRALMYATGLGDDMIAWRIGNGGDHESAVGIVSDYENRDQPYEVRLEWVKNEGWMPIYVRQLEENPIRN